MIRGVVARAQLVADWWRLVLEWAVDGMRVVLLMEGEYSAPGTFADDKGG
jgi:hypothetical protein